MSILINHQTKILIQGITGSEGLMYAKRMIDYKTNVVAGVTPGKGGEWVLDGKIPVFDLVQVAVEVTEADASVIFVPARHAPDAILEAADAGISLIICITEGIPLKDMMNIRSYLANTEICFVGPNSPGIITPGEANAGMIPGDIVIPGNIGVVSRSSSLTYEVLYALKKADIGVSTCVGIGADPIHGFGLIDALRMFEADPFTEKVVLIGEIGGDEEERAAQYITKQMTKPILAFIAGQTAQPGKKMGHAGAIIEAGIGCAGDKIKALWLAGVRIATNPEDIPNLLSS